MKQSKFLQCVVWGTLLLTIGGIGILYFVEEGQKRSNRVLSLPIVKSVDRFSLTNQLGKWVTLDSLRGRPWVANVFFSRCPTICAQVTQRMKELQEACKTHPALRLVSITTDPEYDRPEILAKYAHRFDADYSKWVFLTGEKSEIARVLAKELLLSARANPEGKRQSELDLYTHGSLMVLVDAESRIRSFYESLSANSPIPKILADLAKLEAEANSF